MSRFTDITDRATARALGNYWDALQNGESSTDGPSTPDQVFEFVDNLNHLKLAGDLDPQTAAPLPRQLRIKHKEMNSVNTASTNLYPTRTTRPLIPVALPRKFVSPDRDESGRTMNRVAATLLVIVVGALVSRMLIDRFHANVPVAPSILAPSTPTTTPLGDVLLEIQVPAAVIPENGVGVAGMHLFTIPANSTGSWGGGFADTQDGIWANMVTSGSVNVTADAPTDVIRADGSSTTYEANTEFTVNTDETAVHSTGKSIEWVNAADTEVKLISVHIADEPYVDYPRSFSWAEHGSDVDESSSIPAGMWEVRLTRVELEPGAIIPAPGSPSLQFGVVDGESNATLGRGPDGSLNLNGAETVTTVYLYTLERADPLEATQES